jgi:transposase
LQARARAAQEQAARQARRERAAELFAQGRTQAEVARELDVSRQSASRWQADGTAALRMRGPTGRRPKIPDSALEGIEQALLEGALAHGFPTDVWTLDRIAVVIQGLTAVRRARP